MNIDEYLGKIKPACAGYQELHVHSVGSFRDAVNSVADIFDATEELGRQAVAITDHGNWTRMFEGLKERTKREKKILEKELAAAGASEDDVKAALKAMGAFDSVRNPNEKMMPFVKKYEDAYVATAKKSVQFIPGVEMYEGLAEEGDTHRYHIILYPKDWEGAKVLFALCNLAQLNKHKDMPRCTMETLRFFIGEGSRGHDHVVGTSACAFGRLSQTLLQEYNLREKQQKLSNKQDAAEFVSLDIIQEAKNKVVATDEAIKTKRAELSDAKKLANKKFESALKRAQAKLDKERSKIIDGQLTLDGPVKNEAVKAAQAALDALMADKAKADSVRDKLPEMEVELNDMKAELKRLKEFVMACEKKNGPYMKLQAEIDELEEQIAALGDTYEQAKNLALEYDNIFGRGNFYIEIQNHGLPDEAIARESLIKIARETGIPLTAANDVHYKNPAMQRKRDIIAALRFAGQTADEVGNRPGNDQLWFKPDEEIRELFAEAPDAIENTNRIAEMCNVFYKKEMHLPEFVDKRCGLKPAKYLSKMAHDNVLRRYPDYAQWDEGRRKEFDDRLAYELGVIEKMGYSSYISIVEDFISFSKRTFGNESIGPGRGSGAGSLVCYLVGITDIDPFRYGLIFERFLNPERVSMPDIDSDLATSTRDKVIKYVTERYAYKEPYWVEQLKGTVCNIYTEGELAARSAIRQVGRVTCVPLPVCDRVAKLIPTTIGTTLKSALEDVEQLRELYNTDAVVKSLYDDAMLAEGLPVQTGVHAAGVIIADKPVSEYAPLFWNDEKGWVIQYDMVACEGDLGLLKMDFLGLRNLDIIMRAKSFIKKRTGKTIDFAEVNRADDQETVDNIYGKADTDGVFQFESGGMKKTLQSFVPQSIDDVILLNAAYRPGPMQFIPDVAEVRFGRKKPHYIVPEMANILDTTYGSPIYQEQIMQLFQMVGFSLGEADIIRRAMSKKHLDELVAAKGKFVEGFRARGASDKEIEDFWAQLLEFAKYAFNKSHAAAYSVVSFYTAWLKQHYPVEYISALLSFSTKDSVALYVKGAKDRNIAVLGPDINKSIGYTAPVRDGDMIRFGLEGIKDIGAAAAKILGERKIRGEYRSLKDVVIRFTLKGIGKSPLVALINAGAMRDLVENRQEAAGNAPNCLQAARAAIKSYLKDKDELAVRLAEGDVAAEAEVYKFLSNDENFKLPLAPVCPEYSYDEMLRQEKEYVGYYVSGNPLDKYESVLRKHATVRTAEIQEASKNSTLAGLVTDFAIIHRKSDGAAMCRFILEDQTGTIDTVCFPNSYRRLVGQFSEGAVVAVTGNIEVERDDNGEIASKQLLIQSGRKLA